MPSSTKVTTNACLEIVYVSVLRALESVARLLRIVRCILSHSGVVCIGFNTVYMRSELKKKDCNDIVIISVY